MNGEPETDTELPSAAVIPAATLLRVMLDVLASRAFKWCAMLMAFSLFAVVMWQPEWRRLIAAFGFTIFVTLPLWWRKG